MVDRTQKPFDRLDIPPLERLPPFRGEEGRKNGDALDVAVPDDEDRVLRDVSHAARIPGPPIVRVPGEGRFEIGSAPILRFSRDPRSSINLDRESDGPALRAFRRRCGPMMAPQEVKMRVERPDHPGLALFTELLDVPCPSGREERLAALIRTKLDGLGWLHRTDSAGNVLVDVPGRDEAASVCCLAAHTDEIGMVVTRIEANGALCVDRSGGLHPWKLGETPVEIVGDGPLVSGVLSMGSTHTPGASDRRVTWEGVRILTGLTPEALSERGVRPGSTAVPARDVRGPVLLGDPEDPLIAAWCIDNRAGVVALLQLLGTLKRDAIVPLHPFLIAFTVHEEAGCHGAKVVAHRERPEAFVAVDGCPLPPGSPLVMDGTPGIRSKDTQTHYDQRLVQDWLRIASEDGIGLQPVVYDGAASDASAVYAVGGAPRVGCVGYVRENSHGYEVMPLSTFDNLLSLLVAFVRRWEG